MKRTIDYILNVLAGIFYICFAIMVVAVVVVGTASAVNLIKLTFEGAFNAW